MLHLPIFLYVQTKSQDYRQISRLTVYAGAVSIVFSSVKAAQVAYITAVQKSPVTPVFVHFMFHQFILRRQHLAALFALLGFRVMDSHVLLHVQHGHSTQGTQRFFELPGF